MFSGIAIRGPAVLGAIGHRATRPSSGERRPGVLDGRLWVAAAAVRVIAVVLLIAGPWTDQPEELAGWDAERFQEIAERTGPAWADEAVEYPPGSVLVFDTVAGHSVVETNRRLVVLGAAAELLAVVALWRGIGPRAGRAFLLSGLPLVPLGLVRLDLLVTALAAVAAVILLRLRDRPLPADLAFAVLVAGATMIKIWPALLVAGAVALGRVRTALSAVAVTAVAGVTWLVVTGAGLDPVDQVLSLRGATGWHVESLPGALVALFGEQAARLELNAYRIGTLDRPVVTAGRAVAVAAIVAMAAFGFRSGRAGHPSPGAEPAGRAARPWSDTERVALVMAGSVAALLITAPLLSPQFLLWLTPWAALLVADGRTVAGGSQAGIVAALLAAVFVVTGVTLAAFGPPNLDGWVPALLLTGRNALLLAVPVLCLLGLRRGGPRGQAATGPG